MNVNVYEKAYFIIYKNKRYIQDSKGTIHTPLILQRTNNNKLKYDKFKDIKIVEDFKYFYLDR